MAESAQTRISRDRAGDTRSTLEPFVMDPVDFSLVLGGPLYQLWRRSHLAGDALQLLHRRIVVLTVLAWVPLLALSVAQGHAWGGSVALPFLYDIETHARLLLATAAARRRGAGRAPAHAPGRRAVRGAWPHPRFGAGGIPRGRLLGDASAQFDLGGSAAHRGGLRGRRGNRLADAGDRGGELGRRDGGWKMAAVARGLVAGPGQPAGVPVPVAAVVFPALHLGAVSVAGVTNRVAVDADASGPLRRPRLSGGRQSGVRARCWWRRERSWPG